MKKIDEGWKVEKAHGWRMVGKYKAANKELTAMCSYYPVGLAGLLIEQTKRSCLFCLL